MKKWSKWKRGIKERRGILCPLHTASNYWLFPVDPVMLISEPTRSINIICMSCLLIIVKFKLCFRIRDKLIVDKLAVQCIIALLQSFFILMYSPTTIYIIAANIQHIAVIFFFFGQIFHNVFYKFPDHQILWISITKKKISYSTKNYKTYHSIYPHKQCDIENQLWLFTLK